MLIVDFKKWNQTPEDLLQRSNLDPNFRTRERFSALYQMTQGISATEAATLAQRCPLTVMNWVHKYNYGGPNALEYKHTGGPPPFFVLKRKKL